MIKVLHLISGGDSGGAKTHIFSLMKGFVGKVDAKTICFVAGDFYQEARKEGIRIELFQQKNRFDMSPMKRVVGEIIDGKYDLVHCHGARANFNALFIRRSLNIPMITTLHSDYLLDFKDNIVKDLIFTPLNIHALKKFPYYIAITEKFSAMLIGRGFDEQRVYVAYNGIDMEKEEKRVSKEEFLKRYGLLEHRDKLLFVMAARIDLVKDHHTLLKAVLAEKENLKNCHFLLAGSGAEEKNVRSFIQKNQLEAYISLLGQVKDPFSLYEAGDVNMLTSQSESFPYALLEGAKEGLPFIATDVGGIAEMAGSKGAVLFPPGDAKRLGEILVDFASYPEKIKPMGLYLHDYVEKNFSHKAMAKRHKEIYEDVLRKQGGKYEDH